MQPPTQKTTRWWDHIPTGLLILSLGLIVLAAGYWPYRLVQGWFGANVWIYVDNTSDQPVNVRLDDASPTTVEPNSFAVIKCRDGQHRLRVQRGDEVLFDETKDLTRPRDPEQPTKYLLNPGAKGRYHKHTVQYGMAVLPGGIGAVWSGLMEFVPLVADDDNLFPGMNAHQLSQQQRKLYWLVHELALAPPAEWREISDCHLVFERAPKKIQGNLVGSQVVFARVPTADYDALKRVDTWSVATRPEMASVVRTLKRIVDAESPD